MCPEGLDCIEDGLHLERCSLQVLALFSAYGAEFFVDNQHADEQNQHSGESEEEVKNFKHASPQGGLEPTGSDEQCAKKRAAPDLVSGVHILCRARCYAVSCLFLCVCGVFTTVIADMPRRGAGFFCRAYGMFLPRFLYSAFGFPGQFQQPGERFFLLGDFPHGPGESFGKSPSEGGECLN